MSPNQWSIVCRRDLAPEGTVSIGEQTEWWQANPSARVCLVSGGRPEYLQSISRRASGNTLYVHPGAFGMAEQDERTGTMTLSTPAAERRHWLLHTTDGKFTVAGITLAVGSEAVALALAIGETYEVVGEDTVAALTIVTTLLTIAGIALVAWKGVLTGR